MSERELLCGTGEPLKEHEHKHGSFHFEREDWEAREGSRMAKTTQHPSQGTSGRGLPPPGPSPLCRREWGWGRSWLSTPRGGQAEPDPSSESSSSASDGISMSAFSTPWVRVGGRV